MSLLSTKEETASAVELASRVYKDPYDDDSASILADWCEARGFYNLALELRAKGEDNQRVVSEGLRWRVHALTVLLSEQYESPFIGQKFTSVHGMGPVSVAPNSTTTISMQPYIEFCFRQLVIPRQHQDRILVEELRVGKNSLLTNPSPIHAEVFELHGPVLFCHNVLNTQMLSVRVRNVTVHPLNLSLVVLGDDPYSQAFQERRESIRIRHLEEEVSTSRLQIEALTLQLRNVIPGTDV